MDSLIFKRSGRSIIRKTIKACERGSFCYSSMAVEHAQVYVERLKRNVQRHQMSCVPYSDSVCSGKYLQSNLKR